MEKRSSEGRCARGGDILQLRRLIIVRRPSGGRNVAPVLKLFIGDDEYRAIGHVAAQWAYFENQVDFLVDVFMGQPKATSLNIKPAQAFKRRMENLRTAARAALNEDPALLEEIIQIADDSSSLRGQRDDIIHGQWKFHREGSKAGTGIKVISNKKKNMVREMLFSAEKAEKVANQISALNYRVIQWCQTNIADY